MVMAMARELNSCNSMALIFICAYLEIRSGLKGASTNRDSMVRMLSGCDSTVEYTWDRNVVQPATITLYKIPADDSRSLLRRSWFGGCANCFSFLYGLLRRRLWGHVSSVCCR